MVDKECKSWKSLLSKFSKRSTKFIKGIYQRPSEKKVMVIVVQFVMKKEEKQRKESVIKPVKIERLRDGISLKK